MGTQGTGGKGSRQTSVTRFSTLRLASPAGMNRSVCSECAAIQPEPYIRCYRCGAALLACRRVRTTQSSVVFTVRHPEGPRIIKVLRDLSDSAGIKRYEHERQVLNILSTRVPQYLIPRIVASDSGVLITHELSGSRVHDILWRPTAQRSLAVRKAGEAASVLAEARLDDVTLPPHAPADLEGYLLLVGEILPSWVRVEAQTAAAEANHSAFVHGDFVPTNWLWDGHRIAVLDFESARMGTPEEDVAMAWARLRFAGLERGRVSDRIASEVLRHWRPSPSVRWRAYALVITVAIILHRMQTRPAPIRRFEMRLLRRSLDQVVEKLH